MAGNLKNVILIEPHLNTDDGSDTLGDYDTLDKTMWPYDPADTSGTYRFSNVLQLAINGVNSLKPVTMRVCEGTAAVTCTDQVRINNAGLNLIFEPGFEMRMSDTLASSAVSAFLVEAPLYVEGLRAFLDVGSTTANRSLFKVRSNGDSIVVGSNAHTSGLGKFISTGASFSAALYGTGTQITTSGFSGSNNNGTWIVLSITTTSSTNDTLIVRDPADSITTEASGGSKLCVRTNSFARTHFNRCLFSMCQTNATVPGFFAIDAQGLNATLQSPSFRVTDCDFEIRNWTLSGTDAVQSTNSWTGGEYSGTPYGVGCMRLSNLRAYHVRGNNYYNHVADYQGDTPTIQKAYGANFLYRDGCMQGIIADNIVDGVCLAAATGVEALPLNISLHTTGNEGGHSLTHSLQIENVVCKHLHYSNTPWDKHRDIQAGRIFPGRTVSAMRLVGGRSSDILGLTTHNFNGPSNTGTFSTSSVTSKVTGTNVHLGISAEDYVALTGFSTNVDGVYQVTAVGTDELTLSPAPITLSGGGDEVVKQQFFAIDAETHNSAKFGDGNHAFRKSAAPAYRLKSCQGLVTNFNEPIDGFQTIP